MLFDHFFLRFLTPKLNLSLQFSSCGPWRVFSHSNSPPHRALGRHRHTSSSRQIHYILCWLEILNYCCDGGNGYFHYSNLWSSIIFCCTSEIYSLFFLIVMMIHGVWTLFSLLFIFLWNGKSWLDNFMFIITLECSKLWIWMGIYFRDILLIRISRGTNYCVQRVFEKTFFFHNDNSPIFNCFSPVKGQIFVIKKIIIKRINNAGLFLVPSLIIFSKGAEFWPWL